MNHAESDLTPLLLEWREGNAGALDILGRRQDPESIPAVRRYLEHKDAVVRQAGRRARRPGRAALPPVARVGHRHRFPL